MMLYVENARKQHEETDFFSPKFFSSSASHLRIAAEIAEEAFLHDKKITAWTRERIGFEDSHKENPTLAAEEKLDKKAFETGTDFANQIKAVESGLKQLMNFAEKASGAVRDHPDKARVWAYGLEQRIIHIEATIRKLHSDLNYLFSLEKAEEREQQQTEARNEGYSQEQWNTVREYLLSSGRSRLDTNVSKDVYREMMIRVIREAARVHDILMVAHKLNDTVNDTDRFGPFFKPVKAAIADKLEKLGVPDQLAEKSDWSELFRFLMMTTNRDEPYTEIERRRVGLFTKDVPVTKIRRRYFTCREMIKILREGYGAVK